VDSRAGGRLTAALALSWTGGLSACSRALCERQGLIINQSPSASRSSRSSVGAATSARPCATRDPPPSSALLVRPWSRQSLWWADSTSSQLAGAHAAGSDPSPSRASRAILHLLHSDGHLHHPLRARVKEALIERIARALRPCSRLAGGCVALYLVALIAFQAPQLRLVQLSAALRCCRSRGSHCRSPPRWTQWSRLRPGRCSTAALIDRDSSAIRQRAIASATHY